MKVKVVRCDGKIEVLTLVPPVLADGENPSGYFGLKCGDGTTHFFDADGLYDGWGRKVDMPMEPDAAMQKALEIDSQREIEP